MIQKFPDSSAAVQIAEEAFWAGFEAGLVRANGLFDGNESVPDVYQAWAAFEPSEACKELVHR